MGALMSMLGYGIVNERIDANKLDSKTISFCADGDRSIQEVSATFYWEKGLEIRYRKKQIERREDK